MASRSPRYGREAPAPDQSSSLAWTGPAPEPVHEGLDREPLTASELTSLARVRLGLGAEVSDGDIEACFAGVMQQSTPRGRWLAAFSSALGRALISEGRDLNTTLRTLIALAPRPRS
jgi:hypothetical protein